MSPVLPDGRYRLCVSMGTDPYYIASIPDKPDTLGVLPGDPSRGPIVRSFRSFARLHGDDR